MTQEQSEPVGGRVVEEPAEADAVGRADPTIVPPDSVSGGIGGTNDGTQVAHRPSTAIPGKPMAPTVDDPVDRTSFEGQASDTPASAPHAERGGTG